MAFEAVVCRFARPAAWEATAGVWWGTCTRGHHVARFAYGPSGDGSAVGVEVPDGWQDAEPPDGLACEACGAPWLADAPEQSRWGTVRTVYDTPDGNLAPGCLFWMDGYPHGDNGRPCPAGWDNCDGRHLGAVLPDGHRWDVDSRARNCALPDDRLHRCWVRVGDPEADPPTVHVSKDGLTCAAGGGSIDDGTYHGHLHLVEGRSTFTAG